MSEYQENIKNLKTIDDIKSFLENNYNNKSWSCAYHYTTLYSLFCILKEKSLKLSSFKKSNDVIEYQFVQNLKKYFFCLSRGQKNNFDNIGMWAMYGHLKDKTNDNDILEYAKKIGIKIYFPKKELIEFIKSKNLKIVLIGYTSFLSNLDNKIYIGSYSTEKKFPIDKSLAGYLKDNSWSYEKEIRIYVEPDKCDNYDKERDFGKINLSEQLIKVLKFYPSPLYSGEECNEIWTNLCNNQNFQEGLDFKFEENFYYKQIQNI